MGKDRVAVNQTSYLKMASSKRITEEPYSQHFSANFSEIKLGFQGVVHGIHIYPSQLVLTLGVSSCPMCVDMVCPSSPRALHGGNGHAKLRAIHLYCACQVCSRLGYLPSRKLLVSGVYTVYVCINCIYQYLYIFIHILNTFDVMFNVLIYSCFFL